MIRRLKAAAVAAAFLLSGILCSCSDCDNSTPVERNGQLHVEGISLVNEHGDANEYADEAEDFFDRISSRYGSYPNVIYEISNEPHGEAVQSDVYREVDWEHDVKPYSERIISVIRNNDPDNVIIAGVPHRNQDLDNGLPVFCTQWGVSLDTGDSGVFYDESREWIDYLNANNISWCNWSIGSRHTESSNVLRLYSDRFTIEQKLAGHWPDEMLSESGIFVRNLIRGEDNG